MIIPAAVLAEFKRQAAIGGRKAASDRTAMLKRLEKARKVKAEKKKLAGR